jgi:hypothetical protein
MDITRRAESPELQFHAEDFGFRFALAIISVQREFEENVYQF